jgi:hypothetical protein
MKYRIGYIDEDPRQVAKYERHFRNYFDVVGYNITKGLTLKKLLRQVYDSDIDLLLIDYRMADSGIVTYNGDKVAKEYVKIKPGFPILIFTSHNRDAFHCVDNPNIIYEKGNSNNHFVEVIRKNILLYRNFVKQNKRKVSDLTEKSKKHRLTSIEKHNLIDAKQELKRLDKLNTEVPSQLLDERIIDSISATKKEAAAFLKSITKTQKKRNAAKT